MRKHTKTNQDTDSRTFVPWQCVCAWTAVTMNTRADDGDMLRRYLIDDRRLACIADSIDIRLRLCACQLSTRNRRIEQKKWPKRKDNGNEGDEREREKNESPNHFGASHFGFCLNLNWIHLWSSSRLNASVLFSPSSLSRIDPQKRSIFSDGMGSCRVNQCGKTIKDVARIVVLWSISNRFLSLSPPPFCSRVCYINRCDAVRSLSIVTFANEIVHKADWHMHVTSNSSKFSECKEIHNGNEWKSGMSMAVKWNIRLVSLLSQSIGLYVCAATISR